PQYYLTGYSGSPLGRGVELLVALPLLAGVLIGGFRLLAGPRPAPAPVPAPARSTTTAAPAAAEAPEPSREGASISFSIAAFAVLAPVALAVLGADYLAPRNLVGAMIPVSVLVAILLAAVPAPLGPLLAGAGAAGLMAVSIDVDLSPRLQRGNWRDVAKLLRHPAAAAGSASGRPVPAATTRVLTTVELGAAPLEYYLSDQRLRNLSRHASVTVSEIDATGYSPLRAGAADPPAPGFRLLERRNVDGLIVYRFVSSIPRTVSEADLRRHVITLAHPEVLVPSGARVSRADAGMGTLPVQMSSSDQNI